MMNGGPSGFHNAPITRSFVITSGVLTVVFRILGRSNNLGLSYQVFAEKHRFSRIIGSVFAFSSTPELMFGLYLLYYFRIFERQIGSNKYSVFILFSLITSSFFEILGLTLFRDYGLSVLASGPYALIFSSFVNFYFNVPVLSRFHIFGVRFSDKSFIYLAGLQLILASWKRSLIPAICGVLAGFLYNLNTFGINRLKFPGVVTSFFSRFSWFSGNSSHLSASRNRIRHIPYAGRRAERAYPPSARRAPIPVQEPPESSVATLVSMGFDGDASRQALMRAGNDINLATNILLQAHSH